MKATAKDLRFHSKEILDSVDRGEEVVITYRGKPKAKIVPYEEKEIAKERSSIYGIWKDNDATKDVDGYIDELRGGRF